MLLINCKINLILTWLSTYVITDLNGEEELAIADTKLDVPVVHHLKVMRLERDTGYFLMTLALKHYNIIIDGRSFFINQ